MSNVYEIESGKFGMYFVHNGQSKKTELTLLDVKELLNKGFKDFHRVDELKCALKQSLAREKRMADSGDAGNYSMKDCPDWVAADMLVKGLGNE